QELNTVRDRLHGTRSRQANVKLQLEELEKRKEIGTANETEIKMIKFAGEEAKQDEQALSTRESELVSQLATEQLKLDQLNKELDDIEREVTTAATEDTRQPAKPKD